MYTETQHCDIGYCLADPRGGFAFQPPRTVISQRERPLGARAVQNCPAVNGLERQLIEMPSPVGLRLTLETEDGAPALSVIPVGTFVEPEIIGRMLSLDAPDRWRHPARPVLRLILPWFFVTDDPCMMAQLPPFLGASMRRWPGTVVARRWPVHLWPQTLEWVFEWDRADQELTLRQGEPLCYFYCEFNHPAKRPRLVEAELTADLAEYRQGLDGVEHITPRLDEMWEQARHRRPARLLHPRGANDG